MSHDHQRALFEQYVSAYNNGDIDAMLSVPHPDMAFEHRAGDQVTASACGLAAFRDLAEQSKELFSQRRQTITTLEVSGEQAFATIDFEAVLAVDLPDGLTAGETLRLSGRSEFSFLDCRTARIAEQTGPLLQHWQCPAGA